MQLATLRTQLQTQIFNDCIAHTTGHIVTSANLHKLAVNIPNCRRGTPQVLKALLPF